jgi:hypothetical protein
MHPKEAFLFRKSFIEMDIITQITGFNSVSDDNGSIFFTIKCKMIFEIRAQKQHTYFVLQTFGERDITSKLVTT